MTRDRGAVRTVRAGGAALIIAALAFMAVFAYLAARFDYPEVLDGEAANVLPRLLAMGMPGRETGNRNGVRNGATRRHRRG